jgi:hypothetical protein
VLKMSIAAGRVFDCRLPRPRTDGFMLSSEIISLPVPGNLPGHCLASI